jgi:hypothetical protein
MAVSGHPLRAQDHTLFFGTGAAGENKAMTNWGLDTTWTDANNMRRGMIFMGTNNVKIVRVGFLVDAQLTNNDISSAQKTTLQGMATVANMAGTNALWNMSCATGGGVASWYQSSSTTVYPDRWALAMQACQRYYNRKMWMLEPFNEPDYGWGQGSRQNLYDIIGYARAATNFTGSLIAGGSTLNNDYASSWFNAIAAKTALGTTHNLAGSVSSYVAFLQAVVASNAVPFHPELHNVAEAIIGANYGLKGGIWWGTAELARGAFVKACQGQRLGYADDWTKWTAAAVYRATNGAVQAFIGASERMAATTSYRFFSKDRDVFYDGNGPQRDFTVTIPGGTGYQVNQPNAEKLVNITWGADVPPPISGRYAIVNRNSGKVLEVPGSTTNWGTGLTQNTCTYGSNQLWDVYPLASAYGGDYTYYTLAAVHSGATADNSNWSYSDGNSIIQYGSGSNAVEHWYLEYTTNGYFKIRNRWSAKCLGVLNGSTSSGAQVVQWSDTGALNQQWRFIPVGAAVEFSAPAAPSGVTATANAASVRLSWKTNSESDLAGYTVLRTTNATGPYEIIARGLTNTSFTDKAANQARAYYYVVRAVDRSLNASTYSAQTNATPSGAPTILARYSFDGITSDSSGNANHPIILNGSPSFVAGKYGSALGFNGSNQYVMLPPGMLAGAPRFTLAAWVYWNGGSSWQRLFDFGNDTTQYLFLTPGSGTGTLRFAITTNGGGAEQIVETRALASNQWVHVAVTCDGVTGCLYTNGVLAAGGSVTLTPAMFNPAINYLGASQFASDPSFSGRLDEVRVANYAMTASQVAWLPMNSAPLPALAHRYSFNETSGSTVADSIGGSAWNGSLPNGGTFSDGQLSLASGSSQYVELPAGILSYYSAVTIDVWATFSAQVPRNTMFFAFGNTNGTEGNNYLFCAPQSGRIALTSTNYTGEQTASSGIDFSFRTNLHLTAVFNPPGDYLALYTNGVLAGVNAAATVPLSAVSNVFSYIGRSLYSGDTYFSFSLNELRLYNGVLQPADVAASQLAGPATLLSSNLTLNTASSSSALTLSWPVAAAGYTLSCSPTLDPGAVWAPITTGTALAGTNYQLTVTPTNGSMFYRLRR